jgi:hypothetical protein
VRGPELPATRQGLWSTGAPSPPACSDQETTDSPKFPSYPSAHMPRSQTPVVSLDTRLIASRTAAFRRFESVGFPPDLRPGLSSLPCRSTTIHISGLNDAACTLATPGFTPCSMRVRYRPAGYALVGWDSDGNALLTHWVTITNFITSFSIPRSRTYLGATKRLLGCYYSVILSCLRMSSQRLSLISTCLGTGACFPV